MCWHGGEVTKKRKKEKMGANYWNRPQLMDTGNL